MAFFEFNIHHQEDRSKPPKGPFSGSTQKSRVEDRPSREEGRGNDAVGRRWTKAGHIDQSVDGPKRATRTSTGSDRTIEQSPLHHQQARVVNKGGGDGVSSPSWERKLGSAESSGHGVAPLTTPGRSRLGSITRGDENLDDGGPIVPEFGVWDESDPKSGEGLTQVFERVRDEKNNASKVTPTSSSNGQKWRAGNEPSKGCCFPWGRK